MTHKIPYEPVIVYQELPDVPEECWNKREGFDYYDHYVKCERTGEEVLVRRCRLYRRKIQRRKRD